MEVGEWGDDGHVLYYHYTNEAGCLVACLSGCYNDDGTGSGRVSCDSSGMLGNTLLACLLPSYQLTQLYRHRPRSRRDDGEPVWPSGKALGW